MARDRFLVIYHAMTHVGTSQSKGQEKIEPLVKMLVKRFKAAFHPHKNLSIDEMVVGWKGRFKAKQYNANKPKKHHVKTYGLCDSSTSYLFDMFVYYGAETIYADSPEDSGHAEKVFTTLMKDLGEGHHVFADRYYTTRRLIKMLNSKKTYYTGTLTTSRKNFPKSLKTISLAHRQSKCFRQKDDGILATAWRDKKSRKPVIVVSTKSKAGNVEVQRKREKVTMPETIRDYNVNMNGCDRIDQMLSYYGHFTRKTIKWWKRVYYWLLELVQINSFILYKLKNGLAKLGLRKFKKTLAMQLCERAAVDFTAAGATRAVGRPFSNPIERLETGFHFVDCVESEKDCKVCSKTGARKKTKYVCTGCADHPHLHPKTCFRVFHTQANFKDA